MSLMSLVSTSNLRSEDFYRQLVVPALSEKSVVLLNLRVISTLSTKVNLPIVNDASVGWVAEGAALPDAALNPQLVVVTPRKLSAYSDLSNESLDDAGSSEIVGAAMAATLARKVDASFFVSGGANAPLALDPAAVLTVDAAPTAGIDACIHACAQMEADSASPKRRVPQPARLGGSRKAEGKCRFSEAGSGHSDRPYRCRSSIAQWPFGRDQQRRPAGHVVRHRRQPHRGSRAQGRDCRD